MRLEFERGIKGAEAGDLGCLHQRVLLTEGGENSNPKEGQC